MLALPACIMLGPQRYGIILDEVYLEQMDSQNSTVSVSAGIDALESGAAQSEAERGCRLLGKQSAIHLNSTCKGRTLGGCVLFNANYSCKGVQDVLPGDLDQQEGQDQEAL